MNYSLVLLHGEEAWCYPGERPVKHGFTHKMNREGKILTSQYYDCRVDEWEASRQVLQFAPREYGKLISRLRREPYNQNITHFVEIREGLVYFKEEKEESHEDKWLSLKKE